MDQDGRILCDTCVSFLVDFVRNRRLLPIGDFCARFARLQKDRIYDKNRQFVVPIFGHRGANFHLSEPFADGRLCFFRGRVCFRTVIVTRDRERLATERGEGRLSKFPLLSAIRRGSADK